MCGVRPHFGILDLLLIQILFVLEELVASVSQMDSLILIDLLQPLNGFDMSCSLRYILLLQAHVDISELLLTIYVQLLESGLMFLFLLLLGETVGDLGLLKRLLRPESVQIGLSVLHTLHLFSLSLHLFLLLSVDTDSLSDLILLSLNDSPLMLSDLIIKHPLGIFRGNLLLLLFLVGDNDLFIHDPISLSTSFNSFHVLLLILLDVEQKLGLLLLESLRLLLADLFTRGNLVDDYLGAALASRGSSFLSLHLGLNSLETLDFHHHVKSLLLGQKVLLECFVLLQLLISDRIDF